MNEERRKLIRNIPSARTSRDFMGNEIITNTSKGATKSEDRTKLVKQKHDEKYKLKQTAKTKVKTKTKK